MTPMPSRPADDLPQSQFDGAFQHHLEEAIARRLYETCDGVTQALLTGCEWFITTNAPALTLVVNCPNPATNWRILNHIVSLAEALETFAHDARIRICSPVGLGEPLEIRIDEIPVFRDLL